MSFDITGCVRQIGSTVSVKDVSRTFNDYGDATESTTTYTLKAVVEVMDGSEDEVKEGMLSIQDIMVWVSDTETNASYLANGNYIVYNSSDYRIKNVLPYQGHYEVHAEKVT